MHTWAYTFPLGDVTQYMVTIRYSGFVLMAVGIIIVVMSDLIFHKSDKFDLNSFRVQETAAAIMSKPQQSWEEQCKDFLTSIATCAIWLFMFGWLGFFAGYIQDWSATLPVRISSTAKLSIGILGISTIVGSVIILWCSDCLNYLLVRRIYFSSNKKNTLFRIRKTLQEQGPLVGVEPTPSQLSSYSVARLPKDRCSTRSALYKLSPLPLRDPNRLSRPIQFMENYNLQRESGIILNDGEQETGVSGIREGPQGGFWPVQNASHQ